MRSFDINVGVICTSMGSPP